jgi:hypothetical protein
MRREFWMQMAALLLGACWLSGCASRETGYRISEETVAFIRPGSTTRAEVMENLGPPLFELQNPRVLAYSWGKVHGVVTKPVTQEQMPIPGQVGYEPPLNDPSDNTTSVESRRWIYCIGLDDQGRVTRQGKFELRGADSVENAVRRWAAVETKPLTP